MIDKKQIEKGLLFGALSFFGGLIAKTIFDKLKNNKGGSNGTI